MSPVQMKATEKPLPISTKDRRSSDKLKPMIDRILSAESITQTLFELTDDLADLFEADKVTIYAIDRPKRQLFSRNFKSDTSEEIRIEISPKSLSGFNLSDDRLSFVLMGKGFSVAFI